MDLSEQDVVLDYESNLELRNKIIECKKRFIDGLEDPRAVPYICPEVAESWIRSKRYGLDPYAQLPKYTVDSTDLQARLSANKSLLEEAVPVIQKFLPLLSISNYIIVLTDNTGIKLWDEDILDIISKEDSKNAVTLEEVLGTNAVSLSLIHKKPVQLIGPSHYFAIFENHISSAAPILNGDSEIIGILAIIQLFGEFHLQSVRTLSLGWVISMAGTISKQLELRTKNDQLETAYQILDTTLSVVDEGFITINHYGMIIHINKAACSILELEEDCCLNDHFTKYLGYIPSIENVLQSGTAVHDLEISVRNKHQDQRCIVNIEPLRGKTIGVSGAILRLNRSDRIDKLLTQRVGAKASYLFSDIKGESKEFKETVSLAQRISKTNANVLLIGESGTGKELFAQAIHNDSCSQGPFIAINCASMPRTLVESELFGYEGGTFTGAEKKGRPGKFELANGGTLFLDEIGDMPIEIQPVLLRVLEEGKVMRLGGSQYLPINVRIIAGTNKDLLQEVTAQHFRADLYFRLAIFRIELPPLRVRREDILLLAHYFIENVCRKIGKRVPKLSEDVRKLILNYNWPGNIRQLENAMVYATHLCTDGVITAQNLPAELNRGDFLENRKSMGTISELEKSAIEEAMYNNDYDTSKSAKILGISRTTLYRKLKEYNIAIKK